MAKAKARPKTDTHTHASLLSTSLYLEWRSLDILFVLFQCFFTENAMCIGEVGHDITMFSHSMLCQFTQPVKGLHYQKMSPWNLFSNFFA